MAGQDVGAEGVLGDRSAVAGRRALSRRGALAVAVCIPAIAAYNWWLIVPFRSGIVHPVNSFFSDIEVKGAPDASLFSRLDFVAGTLFAVALLLSRSAAPARRAERRLFLTFAAAAAGGALFPFACAEGDAPCRAAEHHFQLPLHHYLHMAFGVIEFVAITVAIVLARRRAQRTAPESIEAAAFRWLAAIVLVAYAPLAVAYLFDRFGALVEPVFFVAFSIAILTEVLGAATDATTVPALGTEDVRRR